MIYTYRIVKCQKCNKEFLVERLLIGTEHTTDILVTCKDCLRNTPLPKDFIKGHPDEASAIIKWVQK